MTKLQVHFSDSLAVYFLKKHFAQQQNAKLDLQWVIFEAPAFSLEGMFNKFYSYRLRRHYETVIEAIPDRALLCFSVTDVSDYFSFVLFYKAYVSQPKERRRAIPLVVGGSLLSLLDQNELTQLFDQVGCFVIGPGESAFCEIVDRIAAGQEPPRILHGASEKRERLPDSGIMESRIFAAHGVPSEYLCTLNFDRCEWGKCKFCHHLRPHSVSAESVENFADQLMQVVHDHGVDAFHIVDNALSPSTLETMLRCLEKGKLFGKIRIQLFGARMDRRFVELAPYVGQSKIITEISWGVESCSQHILSMYKKGVRAAHFAEILEAYSDVGVNNELYILFGLPRSRDEDIELTARWLEENRQLYRAIRSSWFLLSSGVELFQEPAEFGITVGQPYRICDNFNVNVLGKWNITTSFVDFTSEVEGTKMSRLDDFRRHLPYYQRLEKNAALIRYSPFLFLLKNQDEWMKLCSLPFA